jgi:phosphatidylglycerol:prolipoprotein diacylglycerol transferase
MPLLEILIAGPYNTAFTVAVLTALVLAHRAGRRDGVPPITWALLLAAALGGAIIGSKSIFLDFQPIAPGEKTVLGGIILGVAAAILAARALRLGIGRTLDALTVPTLVGMAIGRVGCFFAGCCAGTATTVPWAVRDADGHSVHPVQLYEGAADLLLIGFLTRVLRDRSPGARIVAATLAYSAIRFLTEFVREGRAIHHGLNLVQWSMLAIGATLVVVARVRASRPHRVEIDAPAPRLARAWRVPFAVAPRLGALLVIQAQAEVVAPRRQLVVGNSFMRGAYEQVIGRGPGSTDCDGQPYEGTPTIAKRQRSLSTTAIGIRQRLDDGKHVTFEAQLLTGRDAVTSVGDGPRSFTPGSVDLLGGGGAFTVEAPKSSLRVDMLGGRLGAPGQNDDVAINGLVRLGDDRRWFMEGKYVDRSRAAALGEFGYVGIGFTGGRDRPRAVFGIGNGTLLGVHVPVRGFELDFAMRNIDPLERGTGISSFWSLGVRKSFALR